MAGDRTERARRRGNALFGEGFTERIFKEYSEWDPEFTELFMGFVYGGLYDREVIPQKWREMLAVAACVCANALPMLENHAKAAIRMGATKQEVQEAILQMATYAGMPYTLLAMRHFHTFMKDWDPNAGVRPMEERS
ncbi:MAG: carboxymuconolactone decarboxylase family protein [Chloroflexi bacterium]|nr:carboxymuconolactone decarboxylase family protein [Chloroflexota bacterium]